MMEGYSAYVIPSEDVLLGTQTGRHLSPVRRFFCLLVTFDLLFTILLWVLSIILVSKYWLLLIFKHRSLNKITFAVKSNTIYSQIILRSELLTLICIYQRKWRVMNLKKIFRLKVQRLYLMLSRPKSCNINLNFDFSMLWLGRSYINLILGYLLL